MIEPIRLIHTGDLHIGVQNYGRVDGTTGMHTRLMDFLQTLDKLVDYAVDNQTDAVLICGDVFKNREPDVTQQREFAKRIKRLSDAGIIVYIIVGNHDLHNAVGKATSVEIYDVVDLPGVYVRRKPVVDVLDTRRGPLQIVALPYASPSNLAVEGSSIQDISVSVRDRLGQILDMLIQRLNPELPAVLMSHFSLIGAVPGSEKAIMLGREVTLPAGFFARTELDYVALGHIHKHQILYEKPPVVYCGSIDRVDFNEEREDKGFVEVSLKKGDASYEFIKLDTRPFRTFYVDATGGQPFEEVVKAIEDEVLDDAIVKIRVKLKSHDISNLRERELYRILRDRAFYVAGIEKDIVSDLSHLRHPGITEKMDIRQAISEYISKKQEYRDIDQELIKVNDQLIQELKEEGAI
ncbi:MAG: exonuclease SbcCD subunit D [Clostridiales bacterium]|nr:exonuclease SbcCD subunit D [Clostridiales bacterium]